MLWVLEQVSPEKAPDDVNWPLKHIEMPSAPDTLTDFVIAHIDTGYARHPEVDGAFAMAQGRDFVDGDSQPDADGGGLLGNYFKHHGTRTGAVLGSRASGLLTGSARDAIILPIRAALDPILLTPTDYALVTQAIDYAVSAQARVISISLGGLWPSRQLEAALGRASQAGVVVVAAAGQPLRRVTWPGASSTVITAAAVNHLGKAPWWSARGPAVDCAAPGDGVWVPHLDGPGAATLGDKAHLEQSWGTSYATALTAGAAALWLKRYAHLLPPTGPMRAQLFRTALFTSGFDGVIDGGTGLFGAGQLSVDRLLNTPPNPVARLLAPREDIKLRWSDPVVGSLVRLTTVGAARPAIAKHFHALLGDASMPRLLAGTTATEQLLVQELSFLSAFEPDIDHHLSALLSAGQPRARAAISTAVSVDLDALDPIEAFGDASPELQAWVASFVGLPG